MALTPQRYRKRPVEIEAVQLTNRVTPDEVARWCGGRVTFPGGQYTGGGPILIEIDTLEGVMTASPGDWIVKGVAGEFYPVKPEIFTATYDLAES